MRHSETAEEFDLPRRLALLPLRDAVLFPRTTLPLFVGRSPSIAAIEKAQAGGKLLLAVAQRRPHCERPGQADLHAVGTIARVLQSFPMGDGSRRVLLEGLERARIGEVCGDETEYEPIGAPPETEGREAAGRETFGALVERAKRAFEELLRRDRRIPREALLGMGSQNDPATVAFRIATHLRVRTVVRQRILECGDPGTRLRLLHRILTAESEGLRAEACLRPRRREAGGAFSRGHPFVAGARRNRQDAGAWHEDREPAGGSEASEGLGPGDDPGSEIEDLARAVAAAGLPEQAAERARREIARLRRTAPLSPEAAVSRNYLEWLLALPWRERTRDRVDLARVRRILDEDHHGLEPVKERILEMIAVRKLSRESRGTILCLAGPPGVGKTSLGRGIARALGRRFVRMSLGGVRDEAEIRGHRRTYVGSLPGRIVQAMRRAGSVNPVILLDEIDKLSRDAHGDPAAALLEVLDPAQNHAFNDHYLEVDYDLSKVLFLATANVLESIPAPLLDRMEVIRLPGYLEREKLEIARRFLVPRQKKSCGLAEGDLEIPGETLARLVRGYTRESGVRGLEREIARLCRRAAKLKAGAEEPKLTPYCRPERAARKTRARAGRGKRGAGGSCGRPPGPAEGRPERGKRDAGGKGLGIILPPESLEELLGAPAQEPEEERVASVGTATGLAWTAQGGEILSVEAVVMPGRGAFLLTGQLGSQMRESARAALSHVRSRAAEWGLPEDFHRRTDIHVHLPKGAVPKDGPSAGVTITVALASALSGIAVSPDVAMTGEITLSGRLLAVGGLGEKLVAARRAGVKTVLLPKSNERHLHDLPPDIHAGVEIRLIDTADQAIDHALVAPIRVRLERRRALPPRSLPAAA